MVSRHGTVSGILAAAIFCGSVISRADNSQRNASQGGSQNTAKPSVPIPSAAPAAIPGVPVPAAAAQPADDDREGGSAEALLNSKSSLGKPCTDANGDTVDPSDPDYKTKCAGRTSSKKRPSRMRIPIPGDN